MSLLSYLANTSPIRHAVDTLFGIYAHHRVGRLDRRSVKATQQTTLMNLLRRADRTRFGRDHGFTRIRTLKEYQERVPLREYEAFWNDYWQPAFPTLIDVTWPGRIPYFALSSGTTTGTTKYIPISRQMLASNRKAALTTTAFFLAAHSDSRLFTGQFFFLGGSTDLEELSYSVHVGDLSGIAAKEVSSFLRPYTFPPLDIALLRDWEWKMQVLAERSLHLPITVVGGVPSWLLVLFERLQKITGREYIADIWPNLRLVIHGGTSFAPYRSLFRRIIGNDRVHFLETYPASEGFIAAEDPRYNLLRLIPDHGIFFEFVPIAELGKDRPKRHTVADLEIGVQYAVVVTTCAGLWSYVIGDTVCFEKREPPLLRFTGRTKYYLSAFGEHLISEEIERAVTAAAEATGVAVTDFHVGPVFPNGHALEDGLAIRPTTGRHRYLVEFAETMPCLTEFAQRLDGALCQLNEDYQAHRKGDLTMLGPEVISVPHGGFAAWLRSRGQLGGQHKVPRMDNSGTITEEISKFLLVSGEW